jgi:hypothetical protein
MSSPKLWVTPVELVKQKKGKSRVYETPLPPLAQSIVKNLLPPGADDLLFLWVANSKLRCDWHLEQTAAMVPPSVVIKDSMDGRRFARSFSWSAATERLVNAIVVVINSELFQLSLQVDCVPDQHVIKKLPSNRSDQPFHERMGHGYVRGRLDLIDLEYAQVGEPTMERK